MLADVLRSPPSNSPAGKGGGFRIVPALLKCLPREDPVPPTADTAFRMSGMGRFCPRMYALASRDRSPIEETVDVRKRWIFGTGTAIHRQFQEEYLQELGDVFQGWWRCRRCAMVHKGAQMPKGSLLPYMWIPRPKSCSGCLDLFEIHGVDDDPACHDDYEYVELEFSDKEHRITGHCDGILDWRVYSADPVDLVEVLEIKTIGSKGAPWVDSRLGKPPKKDHVFQVQAYLWGVDGTCISQARILYVEKAFDREMVDVLCEHVVEKNSDYIEALKRALRRTIIVLKRIGEWHELPFDDPRRLELELPERLTLCRKASDYRAKYCPMKRTCFRR